MAIASKPNRTYKRKNTPQSEQNVRTLRNSRHTPLWLKLLCHLQQRFSAIAWLLVAIVLIVYGWSVYSEKKWSQDYGRLKSLQIYEQQLTRANEVLKNQLANQAQQLDMGLVPPDSAAAIVLQPTDRVPKHTPNSLQPTKPYTHSKKLTNIPLGY
jgi:hypothetical protein